MKHFAILRDVPADLTWDQVDASAIQNMLYMIHHDADSAWEPRVLGVEWVRSYWEPGSNWGTCLYTGPDEKTVRDWHELCQVPYAGIREIELQEATGAEGDYARGFHEPADAAPLVVIEGPGDGEGGWIRSYRDVATGIELRLYRHVEAPTGAAGIIRRVVEIRPGDYS